MVTLLLGVIYLSFVSLGLPDALLGAAWPVMYHQFAVPVSYAGAISLVIAMGTVVSSLLTDRLVRRIGTCYVTAFSTALTALALFGFSVSNRYWMLILWSVPYGLGAGCVDACLNNYVALHFSSRHMSWLHCMWGLGASIGPYIMGAALSGGMLWNSGYRIIGLLQLVLCATVILSRPIWKQGGTASQEEEQSKPLTMGQILALPGAKEVMVGFFCYCALEQTAILWGSSYFVMRDGLDTDTAASLASLFFIGITLGRFLSGFATLKISDTNMIRLGEAVISLGVVIMLLPIGGIGTCVGLITIGFGCAPIYPCIIHSTPDHFGREHSQALIGVQMASAYVGICVMPPLFGILANHFSASWLPWYLAAINAVMILMCEGLNRKTRF